MNNIIDVFKTEKELFDYYPKNLYWSLKDIFNDYWDSFLDFAKEKNLTIRDVVIRDVKRMMKCQTPLLGYSLFKCPECGHEKFLYNTCKSRFCNTCGIKYAKLRALTIESILINAKHRHIVFTMSNILWPLFLEDRKLLDLVFKAVSKTLNSWYKETYKGFKPGFILTLHTFGRDDKWNVHMHCLLSETILSDTSEKKVDYIPFNMLRKRFQTILLKLLEKKIGAYKFRTIKNKIYASSSNGFYVRAKKNEFPDSKKAISYVLRYCGRPCFAQYRIIDIDDKNYISFWYQRHEDDSFVVEKIHIFEFIARLIRHIPEPQFKTIRYYGFYSSKKPKTYKKARKLIPDFKVEYLKKQNKWRNLFMITFKKDPLMCPNCNTTMTFEYVFT